jgi:hypothetical protein
MDTLAMFAILSGVCLFQHNNAIKEENNDVALQFFDEFTILISSFL